MISSSSSISRTTNCYHPHANLIPAHRTHIPSPKSNQRKRGFWKQTKGTEGHPIESMKKKKREGGNKKTKQQAGRLEGTPKSTGRKQREGVPGNRRAKHINQKKPPHTNHQFKPVLLSTRKNQKLKKKATQKQTKNMQITKSHPSQFCNVSLPQFIYVYMYVLLHPGPLVKKWGK